MVNSRFQLLFPDLASAQGELLERAYPGYKSRRVYSELLSRLNWTCYGPVWSGQPTTLEAWRKELVASSDFAWLLRNAQGVAPMWHANLASTLSNADAISKAQSLRLVHEGLLECIRSRGKSTPTEVARPAGLSEKAWQKEINFPRKQVIESLIKELGARVPGMLHSALLHGSAADGKVVDGFSDCDLALILKLPEEPTDRALMDLSEWVMELNRWLLAYNPAAHHGPALLLEQDLSCLSPVRLPPVLLQSGLWIGNSQSISYVDDPFERISIFGIFESFFETGIVCSRDVKSAFDAIWWTANTNILPCLLVQLLENRSVYKADIFARPPQCLPADFHPLLKQLETVRQRIGNWVTQRLPDPVWPLNDAAVLGGVCLDTYKNALAMTPRDLAEIGLSDELIREGRRLWEYASGEALRMHWRRLKEARAAPSRMISWPAQTVEVPQPASMSDYGLVRAQFLAAAAREQGLKAVYEYGQVGCPGLSDLDLLVILRRDFRGIPGGLTMEAMGKGAAAILGHEPIFIGEESLEYFSNIFPVFQIEQLWGEAQTIDLISTLDADAQAILFSVISVLKYPRDILWLCKQLKVRWTTLLAHLNSFNYAARCLKIMGCAIPEAVAACVLMNKQVREQFVNDGRATLADLAHSIDLMLRGSAALLSELEAYWRRRFPGLEPVLAPFSCDELLKETFAALESSDDRFPPESPALAIIGDLSSMSADDHLPKSKLFAELIAVTASTAVARHEFAQRESAAGRAVLGYVRHPRFYADAPAGDSKELAMGRVDQLRSPQYERFMLAMNCFAAEHKLRTITQWSKIWEYPWLWFNALREVHWAGKVLVDIGSELSPMPWFIAQQGARVELVETHPDLIPQWESVRSALNVTASFHTAASERLPFADSSVDAVTSFSVIEHQPDKQLAIDELVRVLKPGGILALSFDICEPDMGMTFPEWNGKALTLKEFEQLIWRHPAFGQTPPPPWNKHDIPAFLQWHRLTAPHHNYIVGAAVMIKR